MSGMNIVNKGHIRKFYTIKTRVAARARFLDVRRGRGPERRKIMAVKIFVCLALLAANLPAGAQEAGTAAPAVNSFYERGPEKEYALKSVYVGGEVADPGPVELASLPVRQVAVKELAYALGKPQFKGAYFFSGYSLYDILNAKRVKKAGADFRPETDLFVIVENDKGEKAVFSWGEIYYARDSFNALIYKSARSITTGRNKDWPLPEAPRLVCSDDLYNTRFIADPSKITVRSAPGTYPGEKHAAVYAAGFNVLAGGKTTAIADIEKLAAERDYVTAGYGHGNGFKGVKATEGFLFKDILAKTAGIAPQDSGPYLVVVSAGDAYRAAFSLSEIINRGDNADFLVEDKGHDESGRFALYSTADFFLDRNVSSVAKVEVLKP